MEGKFVVECIIFYMGEDEFFRGKKDFKEGLNGVERQYYCAGGVAGS